MRDKLSVLAAMLIGPALVACMSNERTQAGQAAGGAAAIALADKPGAPIDSLLEAHNNYLMEASRPDLQAPRSPECGGTTVVGRDAVNLADGR